MNQHEEVIELIRQAQEGCAEAAQKLYTEHEALLRHVIRQRLGYPLRRTYDSDDFLQAVWASFFRADNGQRAFDSPEALMGLLKQMAKNKVTDAYRQSERRKENLPPTSPNEPQPTTDQIPAPIATPSQEALAEDTWNRILKNQPRLYQCVLEMLRKGYTHQEIADHLHLNENTIRRLLTRITAARARS